MLYKREVAGSNPAWTMIFNPAVVECIHKGLKNPRLLDCEVELASGTTFCSFTILNTLIKPTTVT